MFDFVGKKHWLFLASAIIILAGIISIALPGGGLRLGTEFQGGTSFGAHFENLAVTEGDLQGWLSDIGHGGALVQSLGEGDFFVRTQMLDSAGEEGVEQMLTEHGGTISEDFPFESVSPIVASETVRYAVIAVAVASLAILLYITWAFRKMPHPFRYGTTAIVALMHDVLVVLGVFSILGRIWNLEIDPMFVTAVLTVVGYSINDTIVVFDRIRENLSKGISPDFDTIVNASLTGTLGRSLNTSITTIMAVLAVYLFVGGTIQGLALALLIGIIAGTYSSIFIASQLLVVWEKGDYAIIMARARKKVKQAWGKN